MKYKMIKCPTHSTAIRQTKFTVVWKPWSPPSLTPVMSVIYGTIGRRDVRLRLMSTRATKDPPPMELLNVMYG